MTRFIALLNDGNHINIPADEMKMGENYITVFTKGNLVAYLDASIVLCAHLSEKAVAR